MNCLHSTTNMGKPSQSFCIIRVVCKDLSLLRSSNSGSKLSRFGRRSQLCSSGAMVLLHACTHNPTGVDPTVEQWEQIRQLMRSKALLPFFDSAYQGFASGSLDADAQTVRLFAADGGELLAAQSYAKNMGLYGERVGALSIVCKTADVAKMVESQLKLVIRSMYSSPPIHGASIVATILKDSEMYNEWTIELKAMTDCIISMRHQLFEALHERGTPGDWTHIIKKSGCFLLSRG